MSRSSSSSLPGKQQQCKISIRLVQALLLSFVAFLFLVQRWASHSVVSRHNENNQEEARNNPTLLVSKPTSASLQSQVRTKSSSPRKEDKNWNDDDDLLPKLPDWIQHYVTWHHEQRQKFPGDRLFDDPNAPPLLIRTCLGLCGGLNDRLGQLPWDLYLANQTGRVLLLHWHRPVPLEHFLLPNGILDWRVPISQSGFFPQSGQRIVGREQLKHVRNIPELFADGQGNSEQPTEEFWNPSNFDAALARARQPTAPKVLRHRLLGHLHEDELERRLQSLGETDLIHWTPSFGNLFRLFFRPADAVQAQLDRIYSNLQLQPGQYSAAHCRVRHPKATPKEVMVKGKFDKYPADKTGLPWEGDTRTFAIATATRALRCAHQLAPPDHPIYLFSDSNDLVQYMAHDLQNTTFRKLSANAVDAPALHVVQQQRVVARPADQENAHIDKQKGREPHEYYGTFVDLFLAANAQCITYGVGYYAVFASKISGTNCASVYQFEAWGGANPANSKAHHATQCDNVVENQ